MSHQEVLSASPNELAMRRAFKDQCALILKDLNRFRKTGDAIPFGIEVEYGLVDEKLEQATETNRNAIIGEHPAYLDVELGAAQLEMRTDPTNLKEDPSAILNQLIMRDKAIRKSVRERSLQLICHGTNPFVLTRGVARSSNSKYQLVPDHHNDNQRKNLQTIIGNPEPVDVGDAAIIGIANSVQANIEARDGDDAIDKLNRSLQIGPMVVSAFGNARFLEGKDTGIQDIRMIGWDISHDTRSEEDVQNGIVTRVGLPDRYYRSLEDYFSRIEEYPFILDAPQAALLIGIGLNWRDTRIKVVKDSFVVEFRPVSTQSTPEENYAAMMFYAGRLFWSQSADEDVLPIGKVRENRNEAMYHGNEAKLWTRVNEQVNLIPAQDALKYELTKTRKGLQIAQVEDVVIDDALDLLEDQFQRANPSRRLAEQRNKYMKTDKSAMEALTLALKDTKGMK